MRKGRRTRERDGRERKKWTKSMTEMGGREHEKGKKSMKKVREDENEREARKNM